MVQAFTCWSFWAAELRSDEAILLFSEKKKMITELGHAVMRKQELSICFLSLAFENKTPTKSLRVVFCD